MFTPLRIDRYVFVRRVFALLIAVAVMTFLPAALPNSLNPWQPTYLPRFLPFAQPASADTNTVVSLTFDDGQASQYSTLATLSAHHMTGTYYINSGLVGDSSYYMTWPQIHDLANAGSEIGGHTLNHTDLTSVSRSAAHTEVCQDRTNLIAQGFADVTSFAYPYAAVNTTAEQVVAECGYTSGRGVGGIRSGNICDDCPWAESIPPVEAVNLQTPEPTGTSTTLAQLQSYVTGAETHGGGWIVLTIHGVCSNSCTGSDSLNPATFNAFLDWLEPRAANGTAVRTVGDVLDPGPPGPDLTPPSTVASCNGGSCTGWFATQPVTVGLTVNDLGGSGVDRTLYTTDGSSPTTSPTAVTYTAPFGVQPGQAVRFASIDLAGNVEEARTLTLLFDQAGPTVSITQPVEGASLRRSRAVTIRATASDPAGGSGMARVSFYLDGVLLGNDATSPYTRSWTPRTANLGARTLTAIATDAAGNATTSVPIHVTVIR